LIDRPGPEENAVTTEDDVRYRAAPTRWLSIHARVLAAFARGWDTPDPHAWDGLMAEDIELNQPLLQPGTTRKTWHEEAQRLVTLLPDIRGEVVSWVGNEDLMFIELRLTATLGGKPLDFRAVDKLWLTQNGTVLRRDSFFDSAPLIHAVMCRPSAWLPWWRSGLGPFLARRRFLGR
jgi:ketosteroid isomerase-like protein